MNRVSVKFALVALLAVSAGSACLAEDAKKEENVGAYQFKMKSLKGEEVDLKDYAGKLVLAVNVASKCGYTPQYKGLQKLHEKYKDKGLVVAGFPCNQFGAQEKGSSEEIAEFCKANYGVTFDMFEKVEVNGDGACDLYKFLTEQKTKPAGPGKVSWNFEKFLIGPDGKVLARFKSGTAPTDDELVEMIEKELASAK